MIAVRTFESFVVGRGNQSAYAAALAVAQSPVQPYNPLIIHGSAGVGKTHLLQAIEHSILEYRPPTTVAHLTAEKFANEYILAAREEALAGFRHRYQLLDVLLLDDIQFLAGFPQEVLWALRELLEPRRQIVFTCDRPLAGLALSDPGLMACLHDGDAVEIVPPDQETRLAILRTKAAVLGTALPEPIMELLAERLPGSVRRLEGALIKISSYAPSTGKPLNLAMAEALLKDVLMEGAQKRSVNPLES